MEQLRVALGQADDDYLTGLSNKGILKRAYKDLEGETPSFNWKGEAAEVTLKSETCVIRNPLGESSCSCPSSGICRHVVTAILWLKGQVGQSGQEMQDVQGAAMVAEAVPIAENNPAREAAQLREEFLKIPLERLKRACGSRRFQTLLAHVKYNELPALAETSIVTVEIPWEQATVRLLSPLEYSTCTCHSKELCAHKAQALLIYQLKVGKIGLKDLEDTEVLEITIDITQAKDAAVKVREHILNQLETGLSRQSPDIGESLERLAIICHRAKLTDFETRLRVIASDYDQYFKRSAAFLHQELLGRLLSLYALTARILGAKTPEELAAFAGSFRSDYEPVGKLKLTGMGARSFSSKTGYEGEIYYFLETGQKKWYTWTDARPTFYEGVRRRPTSSADRAEAPWGLPCNREQLTELEFELSNAKAASGERLSVSQDTKGVILGKRNMDAPEVRELIYEDYEGLLNDYFGLQQKGSFLVEEAFEDTDGPESPDMGGSDTGDAPVGGNGGGRRREQLALVRACGWEEPVFDSVSQRFSWALHDRKGRTIFVSLRYTKTEKLIIGMLERLEQRLKQKDVKNLLFLGAVYLEEGKLCLYPIEFFRTAQKTGVEDLRKEPDADEANLSDASEAAEANLDVASKSAAITAEIMDSMEQYRQEAIRTLSDLLISGLSSVQEDVLSALSLLAEDGTRMGLSLAGEEFSAIREILGGRRHRMEFDPEPASDAMERLNRYLRACGEKLSFDRARCSMGL